MRWVWLVVLVGCSPTLKFDDGEPEPPTPDQAPPDAQPQDADPPLDGGPVDARIDATRDAIVIDAAPLPIDAAPRPIDHGPCMPGAPERCNAYDDDCDGLLDEEVDGVGQPCTIGEGRCLEEGVFQCRQGIGGCSAVPVDEGCACEAGHEVGCPLDGFRPECSVGVRRCEGGVLGACQMGPTSAETCDGLDNDCDNEVDEDIEAEVGADCRVRRNDCSFRSTEICAGRDGIVCDDSDPPEEDCNGGDEDCDGEVDEGCPPEM